MCVILEDRSNTGNIIVIGTQPRNKLGNWESKDDKVSATTQQDRTKEKREGSQKRKKGSNPREREKHQMGNKQ